MPAQGLSSLRKFNRSKGTKMVGRILWWDDVKATGIIQIVDAQGVATKYFLLGSKIVQRPQQIKASNYVKFRDALQPKRPDLLPVAINVVVSERPLTESVVSGASALLGGVS
jgi:hypothetical protein